MGLVLTAEPGNLTNEAAAEALPAPLKGADLLHRSLTQLIDFSDHKREYLLYCAGHVNRSCTLGDSFRQ